MSSLSDFVVDGSGAALLFPQYDLDVPDLHISFVDA